MPQPLTESAQAVAYGEALLIYISAFQSRGAVVVSSGVLLAGASWWESPVTVSADRWSVRQLWCASFSYSSRSSSQPRADIGSYTEVISCCIETPDILGKFPACLN